MNDVTPPKFKLLTKRVVAGRPLLAARVTDLGSGVDPLSLVIEYRNNVLLGASLYDPASGLALFGIPRSAPPVRRGLFKGAALAADNQESKNVDQIGANVLPNTTIKRVNVRGTTRPTVTWLLPLRDVLCEGKHVARGRRLGAFEDQGNPLLRRQAADQDRPQGNHRPLRRELAHRGREARPA